MTFRLICCLAIAAMGLAAGVSSAAAQTVRPLPIDDDNPSVYQRVLTRPATPKAASPGGDADGQYQPFTPLYVYARDGGWAHVGPSPTRGPEAWVPEEKVVDWKQNIVAAFTNPAGRSRQLMFETEERLMWLMNHESLFELQPVLLEETDAGAPREEARIASVEPQEHIDIRENFYVLPVLEFTEDFHPLNYDENLHLKVASLPLSTEEAPKKPEDFEVGVIFVMDTTQSMDPYIAQTQDAVADLVRRLSGSDMDGKVSFGVIGFRDETSADDTRAADAPKLEYRVREIARLERRASSDAVLAAISDIEEAKVSSPGFNEDSFSAIAKAIEDTDWAPDGKEFGGKYVILVTDAGPKLPRGAETLYDHEAADLQTAAQEEGIAIMTVHLKTPGGGEANHDFAESQYQELSRFGDLTFYYPIEGGSAEAFRAQTDKLVTAVKDEVLRARGEEGELSDAETGEDLLDLGFAMRLAYLGSVRGTKAPDVFSSWVSRLAVEDPSRTAFTFRLLITKNELATMAELVEEFIDLGEKLQTDRDAESFHSQIRETIVRVSQNPDRIVNPDAEAAGDAMSFLRDLPYRSEVLRMGKDEWMESSLERRVILDGLLSKLRRYQRLLRSDDAWTALHEGAPDGEYVHAMPVQYLP